MTTNELVERARTPRSMMARPTRRVSAAPGRGEATALHARGGGEDDQGDEEEDETQNKTCQSDPQRRELREQ